MLLDRKATAARPNGYSISTGVLGTIEHDTLMCCHCGEHWQHRPGSGKVRGFCTACNGPICGPKCKEHFPIEKRFDLYEKGRMRELTDPLDAVLPAHTKLIVG